jgi:hypothetical protein
LTPDVLKKTLRLHQSGISVYGKRRKPIVGLTERAVDRRESVVTRLLILSDVLKLSTHEHLLSKLPQGG